MVGVVGVPWGLGVDGYSVKIWFARGGNLLDLSCILSEVHPMLKVVGLLLARNHSVGLGVLGCVVGLQSVIAQDLIVDTSSSLPFF